MKDGKPTRLKLALKKWGFGSKEAAAKFLQTIKREHNAFKIK